MGLGIFLSAVWIFAVPAYADLPLKAMLTIQPEVGYALLTGTVVGTLSTLLKFSLRSHRIMSNVTAGTA